MIIASITAIVCFFIYLFVLFVLTKDDYVFLRKNLTVEEVFNIAFITGVIALFFSRLFFVIFHFSWNFLNPLVFFLIPYFPGLSLLGGVLGGLLGLSVITKRRRYPRGRTLDFFSLAVLTIFPFGYLGAFFPIDTSKVLLAAFPVIYYTFLALFAWKLLLPRYLKGQIKDGMVALIFFMNYSLVSIIQRGIVMVQQQAFSFSLEEAVLVIVFLSSIIFYLQQAKIIRFKR